MCKQWHLCSKKNSTSSWCASFIWETETLGGSGEHINRWVPPLTPRRRQWLVIPKYQANSVKTNWFSSTRRLLINRKVSCCGFNGEISRIFPGECSAGRISCFRRGIQAPRRLLVCLWTLTAFHSQAIIKDFPLIISQISLQTTLLVRFSYC